MILDAMGPGDEECMVTQIKRGSDPFYDLTQDDEELKQAFAEVGPEDIPEEESDVDDLSVASLETVNEIESEEASRLLTTYADLKMREAETLQDMVALIRADDLGPRQCYEIVKHVTKLEGDIPEITQVREEFDYESVKLTMEWVRQHDQKLYELEVELVQLRSSLISLTYDFDYNVVINYLLRNAQTAVHRLMIGLIVAQYNVDHILEYLRAMATHQCSPVLISPPALRTLLRKVKDRITPNSRLKLPYHIDKDIWKFYDVLKVTPVVLDRLLVILLTIPLTDQSLEMNLYRVHNLPLTAPDLHMTATYNLEGEYLAIGKKGMYVAIPDRESIQICIMSELGLCTMKTALYPADMVEWCLYALFQENDKKIDQYCKYQFKQTATTQQV